MKFSLGSFMENKISSVYVLKNAFMSVRSNLLITLLLLLYRISIRWASLRWCRCRFLYLSNYFGFLLSLTLCFHLLYRTKYILSHCHKVIKECTNHLISFSLENTGNSKKILCRYYLNSKPRYIEA